MSSPPTESGGAPGPALGASSPLPGDVSASRRRLPTRSVIYWRLRGTLLAVVFVGLATWGAAGLDWFTTPIRWTIVGLTFIWFFVIGVALGPPFRRRFFWYSLSDREIDLQKGWLVQTRTVVPMSRVQHLKTERGLLARRFDLADLHIHTAAGAVVIDGLDGTEAAQIRTRIGELAGLADDV